MEPTQADKLSQRSYRRLAFAFTAFVSLLLIFIIIAAIILHQQDKHVQKALTYYTAQLADTRNQLQQNNNNLQQLNKIVANLQWQAQQSMGGNYIWRLNEANYLVRLAQYNLLYLHDMNSATTLLQSADQNLAKLNDIKLEKVRTALAHNIASLQAIPRLDLQGILDQLNALQTQVTQLPIFVQTLPTPKAPTQPSTPSNWHAAWKKSLETLQNLIIIRRTNQPIEPILPEQQQAFLQQNLHLILQQAQWAALRGQQKMYQRSLDQAKEWTQHYFANNVSTTQAVIQTISNLQKVNVQPSLPDLTTTLNLILQATNSVNAHMAAPVVKPVNNHQENKP